MKPRAARPAAQRWASVASLGVDESDLTAMLATAGRPAVDHSSPIVVSPIGYDLSTPATAALLRVAGADGQGNPWSLFCKVIQHPRHWLADRDLPEEVARTLISAYPWRQELGLWDERFAATMPTGLRAPRLHRVIDLGDDRVALWMEDVPTSETPWDAQRYAEAARLIGAWNQRARDPRLLAALGHVPHFAFKTFVSSMLRRRGLQPLADDGIWAHPWLAEAEGTRARLTTLAAQLDSLIQRLDAMPLCRPHGDACPQNLLVPADAPDTFVAIDVSQQVPTALGCDLAQLVVGLVHAGTRPASDLSGIVAAAVPSYISGLRRHGWDGAEDDIVRAFWTAMLIRSGFDSIPYELLAGADERTTPPQAFAERVALTEFIAAGARDALLH